MKKAISVLLLGAVLTGCCCHHGHRRCYTRCHKVCAPVKCAPVCETTRMCHDHCSK